MKIIVCADCGKKAQLKIQQMAFMLIAVTLFFVLAGMFVLVIKFSSLKDSVQALEEKNAILLVSKIANSPEFSCGNSFGTGKVNCVDTDKVMVLKENIGKYPDFWGVNNIQILKIYPKENLVECNLGTYPNCNLIKIFSKKVSGFSVSNFVSLCRKEVFEGEIYNKCEMGRILISYDG